MELIKFDSTSVTHTRKKDTTIRVTKSGAMTLSKAAAEILGLKDGDAISLFQDKSSPEDGYLSIDKTGFPIRFDKLKNHATFNAALLANKILEVAEVEEEEKSKRFKICQEPVIHEKQKLFCILTVQKS